ncbi:uncharacterized protein LOC107465820 [Arachis duranensis]|uniref:Uncharacterized protein LOC107465820 n=1 Tax=Arachis duranensis TaxID=130453 RepID=A0A6P4C5R0_ARADU|nr:uncharacterized protein LOC107465820 [Arachis duranensis]
MGVEHPNKGGQPLTDNNPPKQASNPHSNIHGIRPPSTKGDNYKAKIPFPHKLCQEEKDKQFARFVEYLRTLEIKIPFTEALEQIPSYAKFMKDILRSAVQIVLLTEECSAIIQNSLPEQLKDPRSFMIPCTLGDACTRTTLCDLRTSINLIPASLIKKLYLTDEAKPTRMCLQLADGSIKIPSGVIEDMIVRVEPFAFPTDFVVLDTEGHKSASLFLGRPFIVTRWTLIDVEKWEVTLRVNKEKFILNAVKAIQHPYILEEYMSIDLIDSLVEEVNMAEMFKDRLDDIFDDTQPDSEEPLETSEETEKPPKLELKPLPSSMKYAFLRDGDTYPMIISSVLEPQEEEALIQVLKTHMTTLRWTISDLMGIRPA